MAIRIERPDDSRHMNMILYGRSSMGKTYLCGTAADYPGRQAHRWAHSAASAPIQGSVGHGRARGALF